MPTRLEFKTSQDGSASPTERLCITSTGDVLIGGHTQGGNDGSKLSVYDSGSNIGIIQVHCGTEGTGDLAGIAFGQGGSGATARAKAAIAAVGTGSYGRTDLCFYVDGTADNNPVSVADEKLRITSDGDVVIGATSAVANVKLTVQDSGTTLLRIANTDDGTAGLVLRNTGSSDWQISNTSATLKFAVGGSEKARIDSSGNIGIATDISGAGGAYGRLSVVIPSQSGGSALQVMNSATGSGDGSLNNIVLRSTNNAGTQWSGAEFRAHEYTFKNQAVPALSITSTGCVFANNIGIGTDNRWKIRPNNSNADLAFEYSTSTSLSDTNIKMALLSDSVDVLSDLSIQSTLAKISMIDTDGGDYFQLRNDGGTFKIRNSTDGRDDISITIADTTSYRVESGGFKPTGSETYENTFVSYFDQATGSYLGGKETYGFGAEITIFGADRTVLKEDIDTDALLASFGDDLSTVDGDSLPESFVGTVLPSEEEDAGGETITATITVDETGDTPILVYDPPRDADSDFVEGNTYVFDYSAAEGYSLGLSPSADNGDDNALGEAEGVTISDVDDTLTYVVPEGAVTSGAEVNLFVTKLVEEDPETITIYVKASSPFTFYSDDGYTSRISALEFVDGNQYVFDMSGASDDDGHPFAIGLL